MKNKIRLYTIVLLFAATAFGLADGSKVSPFTAIRWIDSPVPEIEVNGKWYRLLATDSLTIKDIIRLAVREADRDWQKSIAENFMELLNKKGHEVKSKLSLKVKDLKTDEIKILDSVSLTPEKYDQAWWYFNVGSKRLRRKHQMDIRIPKELSYLVRRIDGYDLPLSIKSYEYKYDTKLGYQERIKRQQERFKNPPKWISREEAEADLDQLEWLLVNQFSYLKLRHVDYKALLDIICTDLKEGISRRDFALQLQRFFAFFGDGHTRADHSYRENLYEWGCLPFIPRRIQGKVAAFKSDFSGFVDDAHLFIKSMSGIPIEEWLRIAAETSPKGTTAMFDNYTVHRNLPLVGYMARCLNIKSNLKAGDPLTLELISENGSRVKKMELKLAEVPAEYVFPALEGKILKGNIGYLAMRVGMKSDEDFLNGIKEYMQKFRNTDGLIIDIRDAGGGSRLPYRTLFPYLMKPNDPPKVANLGALRLDRSVNPHPPDGFMRRRFAYPLSFERWTDADRVVISEFWKNFKPEWDLPKDEFSDFHFMLVHPYSSSGGYYYDKPVVILQMWRNFSASDIFLGGFKDWRSVTLLGTPSSGGSGFNRMTTLSNSAIRVRISSMASFQPNGLLYEGHGIKPDIHYEMTVQDWRDLFKGKDPLIEKAREIIKTRD